MSDISLLLKHGWENIWKDKTLWLFSALVLVEPLFLLVFPNQKNTELPSSFLVLAENFIFLSLVFISNMGTTYVAYCIMAGNPVNIQTTFQAVRKFFWRVVASAFFLFLCSQDNRMKCMGECRKLFLSNLSGKIFGKNRCIFLNPAK